MSKLTTLVCVFLFSVTIMMGQDNWGVHRIQFSAGTYTTKDWHVNFSNFTNNSLDFDINQQGDKNRDRHRKPTYFLDFSFFNKPKYEYGLSLGYQNIETQAQHNYFDASNNYIVDTISSAYKFYTIMPYARYNWLVADDNTFELYTSIGIGISYVHNKNTPVNGSHEHKAYQLLAMHWTPIGISFGNKLSGFFEFGVGTKGALNGGISLSL